MDDRADRLERLLESWKEASESAHSLRVFIVCQDRLREAERQLELAETYRREARWLFAGASVWFAISAAIWFAM